MGIIRRLREWREKADGTLTGPALEAQTADIATNIGWTEVENNPLDGVGAQEHTIQIPNDYQHLKVFINKFINTSGSSQGLFLRINNSTQVFELLTDGTSGNTSNVTMVDGIGDGKGVQSVITIGGLSTTDDTVSVYGPTGEGSGNYGVMHATVTGVSTNVDQLTFRGESGNVDVDISIYGRRKQ